MKAGSKKGSSLTWRSILKGRDLLQRGLRMQVGDGESISIWQDPWLPKPYTFRPFSQPMSGTEEMVVADLISDDRVWERWLLDELFSCTEVQCIEQIPLSMRGGEDRWMWHFYRRGIYSVKSGYHTVRMVDRMEMQASSSSSKSWEATWRKVWRVNVPPKVRMHA